MSGMTCECLSGSEFLITHLYRPPPVSGVHLRVDSMPLFRVMVMSLRGEYHIMSKFRVAKDGLDGWQNLSIVKFKAFTSDVKLPRLEWRAPRKLVVNDIIQLTCCLVRETKSLDDLTLYISESLIPDMKRIPLGLQAALSMPMRSAHITLPSVQSPSQAWSQTEPNQSC